MNTVKLKILEETLKNKFNIERFRKFTREFFNEPEIMPKKRHIGIWKEYEEHIEAYYKVARYTDSENNNNMIILAVELKKDKSVERARSMQRNFISKVLDENKLEAAVVAFYTENEPNWRLSFVRLDYSFTDKGIKLDLTPARRYSYLVGENEPNNTAVAQLLTIFEDDTKNPTVAEIEEAFSVEKVTKEFFALYKDKYLDLKEHLENNEVFIDETKKLGLEVDKFSEQFAKKMMGQLAFMYFLQKKGWLGVRIMPKDRTFTREEFEQIYKTQDQAHKAVLDKTFNRIRNGMRLSSDELLNISEYEAGLLSDCFVGTCYDSPWGSGDREFIRGIFDWYISNINNNFFKDYLEPLFYDALNRRRKNDYFKLFNCKIPFLNGGLFEPIGGYHWRDVDFQIPNELFSNEQEKGREADGILDIFDRFNFTMNEDEPLEKEVAVDPEMLGKIFENLLDVSDRKSKGAFYTPREIVHYMCQESLINYLVNEVEVPYGDMKEFILYGEIIKDADSRANVGYGRDFTIKQSIFDNIVKIDEALKNVKIADPAVGSGAFPLGMLNEIVKARNNITEYIIRINKEGAFDRQYDEDFIRDWRSPYKMKLHTIKNSIFAVDIEPSAVDIAKLRLWLSVVVDQEIDDGNPELHSLPNLDYNIKVGNSLIDEYEGIKLFDEFILKKQNDKIKEENESYLTKNMQMSLLIDYTDELLKDMFELQDRYFDEDNEQTKIELKKKIDSIRDELIRHKLRRDGNIEGLKRYEESLNSKTKPYFIWELEFARVFSEKGGFDIVIGNPPYVGESGNKEIFRAIAKTEFGKKYYMGKMDLFYFFFHLALDIGNKCCEIALITTNYFPTAFGAKILRADLKIRSSMRRLINFNELKIFDSAKGQHNMITILTKKREDGIIATTCVTKRRDNANSEILSYITSGMDNKSNYYELSQDNIYEGNENYIRLNGVKGDSKDSIDSILNKMSNLELKLGDITDINQGLVSGCDYVSGRNIKKLKGQKNIENGDGIFIFDLEWDRDRKIIKGFNDDEKKLLRPFYKNSEINRYYSNKKYKKLVLYIGKNINSIDKYPNIKAHFIRFLPILKDRREVKNGKIKYFNLQWARKESIFKGEKMVVPYRTKKNAFAYNEDEWFCRSDIYVITQKDTNYNLKYLLALLNSKPYYLWLYYKGKRKGETLELFQVPLSEIPIKALNIQGQNKFAYVVNNILDITIQQDYLCSIEKQNKVLNYEREIDKMVYDLYEFTKEEIEIIENHYISKK